MNKDTFCILPFIHLEAKSNGFVAPCCMSEEHYKKDNGTEFNLLVDTLRDVWESDSIKKLRHELKTGIKSKGCRICWLEEQGGAQSKRMRENFRWGTDPYLYSMFPKFVDLKLGNTCNLKCRICTPDSSSLWAKEEQEISGYDITAQTKRILMRNVTKQEIMQWPNYNENFWKDIEQWLPIIEMFEIYGGEPFLIQQQFNLLKQSVEIGASSNQTIHYNSNGTIYPNDAINNIWPHFKSVDIMLSIDGIGKQYEYQRHPAKWDIVENNIDKFVQAMGDKITICLTVSSINVYYLPEYLSYFRKKGLKVWLNVLYNPDVFSVKFLPEGVKKIVNDKLIKENFADVLIDPMQGLLAYLNTPGESYVAAMLDKLDKHDKYRNENYSLVFPEFYNLIKKFNT